MLALLPYIEKAMLVANLTSSGYGRRKSFQENCVFWVVIALSIVAYILIIAGVGLYLAEYYELPVALMVTGLVILLTVLFSLAVVRIQRKMRSCRIEKNVKSISDEATKFLSSLGGEFGGVFKDNAGLVAIIVAGLGFMAARKII